MSRVSIIVTTFNVADYVETCLTSIANQTLRDIEVVVVDDGSTDGTAAKVTAFAQSDPRFVPVLLPENSPGGVATAANVGLDRARSPWVGFVDGDDYIEPTMFESLLDSATVQDADLAMCNYREVSDDGTETRAPADDARWAQVDAGFHTLGVEAKAQVLRFISVPWRKLYRRSMLEEHALRFPLGDYFYEDNPFHWFTVLSASSISFVPRVEYYHRIGRSGQTMTTADSRLFKIFEHHDTISTWLAENGLSADFDVHLLVWVISQLEWISRRTPKGLRRELYGVVQPIISGYPPESLARALKIGEKGAYAHRVCASLTAADLAGFMRALDGRPDTENYVRLGLYHLRYSGVRKTLAMTGTVVRDRLGRTESFRGGRDAPGKGAGAQSHADVMFGLSVLQQRLEAVEQKLDRLLDVVDQMQMADSAVERPEPRDSTRRPTTVSIPGSPPAAPDARRVRPVPTGPAD